MFKVKVFASFATINKSSKRQTRLNYVVRNVKRQQIQSHRCVAYSPLTCLLDFLEVRFFSASYFVFFYLINR